MMFRWINNQEYKCFEINFSIFNFNLFSYLSGEFAHMTDIRYNKIITCFECTSQNNILNTRNGQCEYNVALPKVYSKKYDGAYMKAMLIKLQVLVKLICGQNITENGSKCNDQTTDSTIT